MAYASWSVVFGEQPSAAKWNILGTNDAAFNNGTGIPSANAATATVATSETTTSATYTDLTTPGPAVTLTISTTGKALLLFQAFTSINSAVNSVRTAFAVSGATTTAATDTTSVLYTPLVSGAGITSVGHVLITGLTPGSNTFTMKYRVSGSTGTWVSRYISVIPL